MNEVARAAHELFSRATASSAHQRTIESLVADLSRGSCSGLADKLGEYSHAGANLENAIAELRLGLAVATFVGHPVQFQSGERADIRVNTPGIECTIEAEHKSIAASFSAVFHPTPDALAAYARSTKPWQVAAHRLASIVVSLPFKVDPWIDARLDEPQWAGSDRAAQEELCGTVAEWLANALLGLAPGQTAELKHPLARFDVEPLPQAPGWIAGYGPLNAHLLHAYPSAGDPRLSLSEWLEAAIRRKAKIAGTYPERRGALHLVGLVIDEAFACSGDVLANTLLGGVVAYSRAAGASRHFRRVPSGCAQLIQEARDHGRGDLITLMQLDPDELANERPGLIFDDNIRRNIDGVIALYYTNALQFVPNPFTGAEIAPLLRLLPQTLEPFAAQRAPT